MHFSVRDDCRVPASSQLPRTPDGRERLHALRPALIRASSFASISEALQQVQDQLPWAQRRGPTAEPAAGAVEPKTGVAFQAEYCQRGRTHCGQLAGVGVRTKRIAGIKSINVYALGLYLDSREARRTLRKFIGQPAAKLATDQAFFNELIGANIDKTLALTISFGRLSRDQFWGAIQERLEPLMLEKGDTAAMEAFGRTFDGIKIRKGLTLSFCFSGDTVTSKVDGKEVTRVRSRTLCQAVQTIYMGPDPVAPDAKKGFAEGIARMLAE